MLKLVAMKKRFGARVANLQRVAARVHGFQNQVHRAKGPKVLLLQRLDPAHRQKQTARDWFREADGLICL